jgi:hypothetical protein
MVALRSTPLQFADIPLEQEDRSQVGNDGAADAILFTGRVLTRSLSRQTESVSTWLLSCPADLGLAPRCFHHY